MVKYGNYIKRVFALALSLILVVGLLPSIALADDYTGHWAEASIKRAVEIGWFAKNDTDTYRPNDSITRAEFVTMINKMKGYTEKTDISGFPDVNPGDWFYEPFQVAVAAGYISGSDGMLNPRMNITRNEAVTIFARISGVDTTADNTAVLANVKDASNIPTWAVPGVGASIGNGLIAGTNGNFNGDNNITRAETAVLLERLYDDVRVFGFSGVYSIEQAGSVMIATPGVTLKNTSITKDLIITEAVGDGEVYLDGVKVGGKLDVKGGGKNSVVLSNCEIEEVVITKDEVRIVFQDGTVVTYVNNDGDNSTVEIGDGAVISKITVEEGTENVNISVAGGASVESVVSNSSGTGVSLMDGATVGDINVGGEGSNVNLAGGASVGTLNVGGGNSNVSLANGASVGEISVGGGGSNVDLAGGASVGSLNLGGSETSVSMANGATVGTITVNETATNSSVKTEPGAKIEEIIIKATASVTGEGDIDKATISATDVKIDTTPGETTVSSGATAEVGGKAVDENTPPPTSPTTPTTPTDSGGSSDSDSDNEPSYATYTVSFDLNGATETNVPDSLRITEGNSRALPNHDGYTKTGGYKAIGWATDPNAETPLASPYRPSKSVTLYLVWELPIKKYVEEKIGSVNSEMTNPDNNGMIYAELIIDENNSSWETGETVYIDVKIYDGTMYSLDVGKVLGFVQKLVADYGEIESYDIRHKTDSSITTRLDKTSTTTAVGQAVMRALQINTTGVTLEGFVAELGILGVYTACVDALDASENILLTFEFTFADRILQ